MPGAMALDPPDIAASGAAGSAPERAEAALWERLGKDGDAAARAELVELYRPFARIVAATYFGRRIDDDIEFDDYHQWALVGMIESVDRFDASRGIRFKTFASRRMHGSILDGIESATEKQRQIATRRRLREERAVEVLAAAREGVGQAHSALPNDADDLFRVLAEVGIGLALGLMLENTGMIAPDPDAVSPDQSYARVELHQLQASIRACMGELSEQEQNVIRGHYMEDHRFVDIAAKLGLTKGRVSQIHRQALTKLGRSLRPAHPLDIAL